MPFCAVATMVTAVILARRSAPEGVWSLGSHGTGCRELFRVLRGQRSWLPRLLVLLRPERTSVAVATAALNWSTEPLSYRLMPTMRGDNCTSWPMPSM